MRVCFIVVITDIRQRYIRRNIAQCWCISACRVKSRAVRSSFFRARTSCDCGRIQKNHARPLPRRPGERRDPAAVLAASTPLDSDMRRNDGDKASTLRARRPPFTAGMWHPKWKSPLGFWPSGLCLSPAPSCDGFFESRNLTPKSSKMVNPQTPPVANAQLTESKKPAGPVAGRVSRWNTRVDSWTPNLSGEWIQCMNLLLYSHSFS